MPKTARARKKTAAPARRTGARHPQPTTVRIEPARPGDARDYFRLLLTALPDEPLPTPEALLSLPPEQFTHGPALCLVARDTRTGKVVGALIGGVPVWIDENPLTNQFTLPGVLLGALMADRIAGIHAIGVDPDHRKQGIGRALITTAEQHFRDAGFKLSTLNHTPDLTRFYSRLGYHSSPQLIILVPGDHLFGEQAPGYLMAAKPIAPRVEVVMLPQAPGPIASGLFRDCTLPPGARFEDGRLVAP
ncbi:GNAT family N-acetyltransferase (plasmid) [Actinacidiphila glaucinigra]|uniref:GNAT family N-acetyltransferase n=1 Tax=Actinacidiphila glaucinigra TaxID=235986 RepID=UPI002DDA3320|nr:GNAT family N-acetyltransferase [Actinacidiphila glaucinigra]WSD65765.1 GNAT family N-acetyltransferase [Actinacidiphila glaucinigra]WSD65947.1 GNAT family N-acetyltransferase [Actinacidiphila glaucinigra]